MNARKRSKKRSTQSRRVQESRTAEAVTVAWVVSTLATLFAQLFAMIVHGLAMWQGIEGSIAMVGELLLVIASITGIVGIGLTPVVIRLRVVPPPRPITTTAIVLGAIPIMCLVLTIAAK